MLFNVSAASMAQEQYCREHGLPEFAPPGGVCYKCGGNIYIPRSGHVYVTGIDVKTAGEKHITSCPHCHTTFCD